MRVVRNPPRVLARTRAFEKSCFRRFFGKLYAPASGIRGKLERWGARLCQNQDLRDLQDFARLTCAFRHNRKSRQDEYGSWNAVARGFVRIRICGIFRISLSPGLVFSP